MARTKKRSRWWRFGGGDNWFQTSAQIPPYGRGLAPSGTLVTLQSAVGLPAVAAAIRLLAETTGIVPLCVYEGDPPERDKARDSWQWSRLHDQPNDEQSAFDFMQDIETSVEAAGNAFVWKAITRRPIVEPDDAQFFVMDPGIVRVAREGGRKVFKVRERNEERTYDATRILHIRGWTPFLSDDAAPSPIALHAAAIGTDIDREDFEGGFFRNNAQTSLVIVAPGPVADEEAQAIVDRFVAQHTGTNAWRPAFVSEGADIKPLAISQRDAQYVESKRFSIEDVCRVFHITAMGMLDPNLSKGASDDFERFLKVDLAPRLRRIELAFQTDLDIFPKSTDLFPEFLTDAVLKPDIQTRYTAYKDAIQGGWIAANEIRERENLPSHPQGEGLQETPVGGAPNPNGQQSQNGQPQNAEANGY